MLWKCCTQYASKCGKCSSGHRTGKGQFSFQYQRRGIPKKCSNYSQLYSFHVLAISCSKSSKLGFNSMGTMNFQMFKMDLGKAEETEIKLATSIWSYKNQENSRQTPSTSVSLTILKPLTLWIITNCGKFFKRWEPDHLTYLLRNLYAG